MEKGLSDSVIQTWRCNLALANFLFLKNFGNHYIFKEFWKKGLSDSVIQTWRCNFILALWSGFQFSIFKAFLESNTAPSSKNTPSSQNTPTKLRIRKAIFKAFFCHFFTCGKANRSSRGKFFFLHLLRYFDYLAYVLR